MKVTTRIPGGACAAAPFAVFVLAGALALGSGPHPDLRYRYRPGAASDSFRPLGRTSLLYGPVEVSVVGEGSFRIESFRVIAQGVYEHDGTELQLCRTSRATCEIDFGSHIARRRLRFDVVAKDDATGREHEVSEVFSTFEVPGIDPSGEQPGVIVEHAVATGSPPDHVTRWVQVRRTGDGKEYRDDLGPDDFRVRARGFGEVEVIEVDPPVPDRTLLVAILFDVSYFLVGEGDSIYRDKSYAEFVTAMISDLERATRRRGSVEYLVVPYAATGRVFGPFRSRGGEIDPETLASLRSFLLEPPPASRKRTFGADRGNDFASVFLTLNDLYLREYDGPVQVLWITDGSQSVAGGARFRDDLWPERMAELNTPWSDERLADTLRRLDENRSEHDEALSTLIAAGEVTAERVAVVLRELDPGGTSTVHPHRVDSIPRVSVLFLPGLGSLRGRQLAAITRYVRDRLGGELWRYRKLKTTRLEELEEELHDPREFSGTMTFGDLLGLTLGQLEHSYRLRIEVPNPHQDRAEHDLVIDALDPDAPERSRRLKGCRVQYMPYYKSSLSARRRLADYLASPFKELRVIAAYELREYGLDDELYGKWNTRWQEEQDDQVRAVLFETWVAMNLQRLQAATLPGIGKSSRKRGIAARENLLNTLPHADGLPDPLLAREAAAAAEWYARLHPRTFPD